MLKHEMTQAYENQTNYIKSVDYLINFRFATLIKVTFLYLIHQYNINITKINHMYIQLPKKRIGRQYTNTK